MAGLLEGRRAVVTGGGRGIGRAIVGRFAEHGAAGTVLDLASTLEGAKLPPGFAARPVDVTQEAEIAAAFSALAGEGGVDIVVANAGIVPPWRKTGEIDLDEWDRVFAVNVRGVAATLKHAARAMEACGGAIVVTASMTSYRATALQTAYTSTKHAVLGIVRCTALELGALGIRVNAVAPGPVLSDALRERISHRATLGGPSEAESELLLAGQAPLKRIATEGDVADAALFLASELSAAITGHLLPVDGGVGIV